MGDDHAPGRSTLGLAETFGSNVFPDEETYRE